MGSKNLTPFCYLVVNHIFLFFNRPDMSKRLGSSWRLVFSHYRYPNPKVEESSIICQRLGGDLGKITTASENQLVYYLLREQKTITHYGVWLGLHRKKDQQFYWVDDTPLSGYTAWGNGEPNDSAAHGGENCVHKIGEKRSWPF